MSNQAQLKLWEVKHSYYCNEGNYYNNDCGSEFKSWADFIDEMGNADLDYNLLFRWDWKVKTDDETGEEIPFNGDVNYRGEILSLFYMHQRKGRFVYCLVEVCRADEPAVREFLQKHWGYVRRLWAPIAEVPA
jgi:hypothetical protein